MTHASSSNDRLTQAANIGEIVGGIIALGSLIGSIRLPDGSRLQLVLQWTATIALGAVVSLAFLVVKIRRQKDRQRREFEQRVSQVAQGVRLLHKEIIFVHESLQRIVYIKKFRLKATRAGVDRYTDKYHWTGSGPAQLHVIPNNHRVENERIDGIWNLYDINLGRQLVEGEEEDLEVRWDLSDPRRSASPFASVDVDEPLDSLKIKIVFPSDVTPLSPRYVVRKGISAKTPLASGPLVFDTHTRIIDKTFPSPILDHNYAIVWKYPEVLH